MTAQNAKALDTVYVRETTLATFKQDVVEASKSKTVFVYFYAPDNVPCAKFAAVLEKYVRLADGKAVLVKMNAVEAHPVVAQLGIRELPATLIFVKGAMVNGFAGMIPEAQLKTLMQTVIGKDALSVDKMLVDAKKLLDDGKAQEALEAYTKVLEKDEANPVAFAGMIRCFLALNQVQAAKDLSDGLEASVKNAELEAARVALDVALKMQNTPSVAVLERKLKENPDDLQVKFDYAVALFGAGSQEKSLDLLLEIVKTDRKWENDKARAQLVDFFKALGQMHPLTVAKRHELSSILFG